MSTIQDQSFDNDPVRAHRAAFCRWFGDSCLAAVCSAVGGPIGLLILWPKCIVLGIHAFIHAFLAGLAFAAVVRLVTGKVSGYSAWMIAWLVFGALAGAISVRVMFGGLSSLLHR
jgi:hypothetical protein